MPHQHDPHCSANYNALRHQLETLKRFHEEPGLADAVLGGLIDPAALTPPPSPILFGVEEGEPDAGCEVIPFVPGPDRPRLLVVADEIIVRTEKAVRPEVLTILTDFGFNPEPAIIFGKGDDPDADDEIVALYRAVRPGIDRGRVNLTAAIDAINENEAFIAAQRPPVAGANVLRPLNVVTKGKSGAEPACCYPEPQASQAEITKHDLGLVVVIDTGRFRDGHGDDWLKHVDGDADTRLDAQNYLNLSAGHGTFIAGIIRQVRPETRVVVPRLISAAGFATDDALAEAITKAGEYIDANGKHGVINLSLGSEDGQSAPPSGVEKALRDLPQRVAVVASAGNQSTGDEVYPAAFSPTIDHLVAVASLDRDGVPSAWSNFGDWVDFSAIGEGVISTFLEGEEKKGTTAADDPYDPEPDIWVGPRPWAVWTGTSFAAPQISALLAEILAGEQSAKDAIDALKQQIGGVEIPGFGLPLPDAGNLSIVRKPERPPHDPDPQP